MNNNTPNPSSSGAELEAGTITRLFRLGLSGPRRPVDALIDRLGAPDSEAWLGRAMERAPRVGELELTGAMLRGADADTLSRIKNTGKMLLADAGTEDQRLTGLAIYFFAVASALAHHDTVICSRTRDELHPVLLDLAAVCPDPWAGLCTNAAANASGER
ncbi:MAG: hypothetical protein JJU33_06975 [Phycisphaerales bacterium]|nr:hypothetical protein [Phycisphaerales bacterium]